jgi:hypothetical protein
MTMAFRPWDRPSAAEFLARSRIELVSRSAQGAPHEGLTLGDHASIAVFVLVA